MRIAFLGTAPFAVPTLDALLNSKHEVVGVVTGPDKPVGRGRQLQPTPVKERALEAGLEILTPEKLKSKEFLEKYRSWKPDAAVVVAYRILPEVVFDLPKFGTLNLHPSLLPKYRGPAPLNWTLINGDSETGISVIRICKEVDAGGVVLQRKIALDPFETTHDLAVRLAPEGGQMIVDALEGLFENRLEVIEQNESLVTKAPKLVKEDGIIDWNRDSISIHNQVRGLFPWPGSYSYLNGKTIKLFGSKPIENISEKPGSVVNNDDSLVISCGKNAISFDEVQLQGKKKMPVSDFLRGFDIPIGTVLGE
jgi:methionyl-tRNA formyltransferase